MVLDISTDSLDVYMKIIFYQKYICKVVIIKMGQVRLLKLNTL